MFASPREEAASKRFSDGIGRAPTSPQEHPSSRIAGRAACPVTGRVGLLSRLPRLARPEELLESTRFQNRIWKGKCGINFCNPLAGNGSAVAARLRCRLGIVRQAV